MRASLPSLVPAPARTNSRPTKTSDDLPPANTGQGTAPRWLVNALDEGLRGISPPPPLPLVSAIQRVATDSAHIRTPEPKRKRLATPEPTPPRKTSPAHTSRPPTTPTHASGSRCYPTAYAFGQDDDPDAKWSTLARTMRKTVKHTAKPSGVKHSGGFRLPLLGLAPSKATRAPVVTRRVITYLPPSMASKKMVDDVDREVPAKELVSRRAEDDEGVVKAKIDPPMRGPTQRAQIDTTPHDDEVVEEEIELTRLMDSDATLVNEDEDEYKDKVVRIDVDDVCARYPATRACMKAVRRPVRARGGY